MHHLPLTFPFLDEEVAFHRIFPALQMTKSNLRPPQVVDLAPPSLATKLALVQRLGGDPATLALEQLHSYGDVVRALATFV